MYISSYTYALYMYIYMYNVGWVSMKLCYDMTRALVLYCVYIATYVRISMEDLGSGYLGY